MREIELYARGMRIADSDGNLIPIGARPVVQWREKVGFTVALPSGSFGAGSYKYAFDYDRDFLHSEPCNSGECAVSNGVLTFEVTFNSVRQAEATNGRVKPIPFYIQITKDGEDNSAEYILDDLIWAAGCVWDGRIPPAPEAPNYYTKAEVDGIADGKLDKPEEAGETGNVLKLGEDGEPFWGEGGGGGEWGSITGSLSDQTDLADALGGKANLVQGKVPEGELPVALTTSDKKGVMYSGYASGIEMTIGGEARLVAATNAIIDARSQPRYPVVLNNIDYAVRSVLPNVTVIPAATTAYTLLDASATTNNHSWQYSHTPSSASTYVFPAVTNTAVAHYIKLTIDFTAVQTYSFEDASGNALTPLFTPTIAAGDVYEFRCEYSAVKAQWLIYPHKQGAVSDDYVMQSQVGAANGVAGLDANGRVPYQCMPLGSVNNGITHDNYYNLQINGASIWDINDRGTYKPIQPGNLNYAVAAALTDAHKIQLTDAQKASAQDTLGVGAAPIVGSSAPTTSTVGVVGQLYVDTATSKTYHCTAKTNTGTEEEPVWSYAWVDDVNSKGGVFGGDIGISSSSIIRLNGSNVNFGTISHNGISCGYGCSGTGLAVGYGATVGNYAYGRFALGLYVSATAPSQTVVGKYNIQDDTVFTVGNGASTDSRRNILELLPSGNLFISGGHQQGITTIPAATTSYTLTEGVQSHAPSAASTYTLPAVPMRVIADGRYFTRNTSTDGTGYYGWLAGTTNRYTSSAAPAVGNNTYTNTALTSGAKAVTAIDERTHECILTVRFSSSVQTYAFEDSSGNPLTPLPLAGTIADGSVVAFRCTWEALLGQWVIEPKLLNPNA